MNGSSYDAWMAARNIEDVEPDEREPELCVCCGATERCECVIVTVRSRASCPTDRGEQTWDEDIDWCETHRHEVG